VKLIFENWNKFVQTEEIDIPPGVEQGATSDEALGTIGDADKEAENVINKVTKASKDPDVRRQAVETMITKLVDFYRKLGN